jgi:hypothetical protein
MLWNTTQALISTAASMLADLFSPRFPLGGGSKTGAQLAKLELFGATKRCRACEKRDAALEKWLQWRKRYEEMRERSDGVLPPFDELNGTPPPEEPETCPTCNGVGYIPWRPKGVLTARPKGSSVPVGATLYEFSTQGAQASILMRRLSATNPEHRDVLTAFHGPAGDYAETNCGSRLLAVVLLTKSYRDVIGPSLDRPKKPKRQKGGAKRKKRKEPEPELTIPKHCFRFEGEHPQAKRMVREDIDRWLQAMKEGRFKATVVRHPAPARTLGPEARALAAGEVLLSELVEWRTSQDKDRQAVWAVAEFEAEMQLTTATATWEQCVEQHLNERSDA